MNETVAPLSLIEHFSDCEDPRRDLGKDHLLIDIIVIGMALIVVSAIDTLA